MPPPLDPVRGGLWPNREDRIIGILKAREAGVSVADLCRRHGVSDATICKWKAKYGEAAEAARGRERRKRRLADAMLDNAAV
ncbi:transposase, partial [Rhodobacter sp. Har01]